MRSDRSTCFPSVLTVGLTLAALICSGAALAIQPEQWTHDTEADFAPGEMHDTVVTNLGDLRLASRTTRLEDLADRSSILNDVHRLGSTLYLAGGPRGALFQRKAEALTQILTLDGQQIFALDDYQGQLLVGISGEPSRVAMLKGESLKTVAELPETRYVWDLLVDGKTIYAATGTEGQIIALTMKDDALAGEANAQGESDEDDGDEGESNGGEGDSNGGEGESNGGDDSESDGADDGEGKSDGPSLATTQVILDSKQSNVLCLDQDGRGRLFAGTDTEGLVYRLTPQSDGGFSPYVLFDAPEPEIGALSVTEAGQVYAGTADAKQAKPGRLEEAVSEDTGRPVDGEQEPAAGEDIPSVPPEAGPIGGEGEDDGGDGDGDGGDGDGSEGDGSGEAGNREAEGNATETTAPTPAESAPEATAEASDPDQSPDAAPTKPEAQNDQKAPGSSTASDEKPSEQQLDKLRQTVKQRLEAARESGEMQIGSGGLSGRSTRDAATGPSRASRPSRSGGSSREGNAVYRIDVNGFVDELFRESVMVLEIRQADGRLLVATGNEGQLFSVDPATKETTTLADLEAEQVPAVARQADGRLLLATANPARLVRLDKNVAQRGTYVSPIMDAKQVSLWGVLRLTSELPAKTSLTVETRTGNVANPEQGAWAKWSKAQAFMPDEDGSPLLPRTMEVQSPPARFVQYRLTLTGQKRTTPSIKRVELAYVTPNLTPNIEAFTAAYPDNASRGNDDEPAAPATKMKLQWEASDPNKDQLLYTLEYRQAGQDKWLTIKEDLAKTNYEWQTRLVPDGRYVLRVTGSDRRDNPGNMARQATRQSSPVVVDNTSPRIVKVTKTVNGDQARITLNARDATSPIKAVAYSLDGQTPYQPVLAKDMIFDSTREPCAVTITGLSAGPHVVTLRVLDQRGNATYRALALDIPKPE